MRAQFKGANAALLRALKLRLALGGGIDREDEAPALMVEDFEEEPWASLTFAGARHSLDIRLEGNAQEIDLLARALHTWPDDADTLLPGHFLAEMQVIETKREPYMNGRMSLSLRVDALTVEE